MNRRGFILSTALPLMAKRPSPVPYRFSGSAHQIGALHGKALNREIRAEADPALRQLCAAWKLSDSATLAKVVSRYEGVFRELVPMSIEEMKGIAEGAELLYPYAFFAGIRDLLPTAEGCTAVVCPASTTNSGKPIIGQTKDTSSPLNRYNLVFSKYDSGFRAISLAYPGWIGNICLTSHGVSWTGNSLYAPPAQGKLYPASLLKRLFYECRSVREALDKARGLRFGNGCFCAADRTGTAVCMEWVGGECDLIQIDRRYGHANNILGSLRKRETHLSSNANSLLRQARIDSLLRAQKQPAKAPDFETWFTDHQHHPRSICRHTNTEDPDVTTAAFIADLAALEFRVAVGNPCETQFAVHRLEDV
jgi:hypothetical protein